jgi:hypothetical protein
MGNRTWAIILPKENERNPVHEKESKQVKTGSTKNVPAGSTKRHRNQNAGYN